MINAAEARNMSLEFHKEHITAIENLIEQNIDKRIIEYIIPFTFNRGDTETHNGLTKTIKQYLEQMGYKVSIENVWVLNQTFIEVEW